MCRSLVPTFPIEEILVERRPLVYPLYDVGPRLPVGAEPRPPVSLHRVQQGEAPGQGWGVGVTAAAVVVAAAAAVGR